MAEIRYGKLQQLNKEIEEIQTQLRDMQGDAAMIKEEVDAGRHCRRGIALDRHTGKQDDAKRERQIASSRR